MNKRVMCLFMISVLMLTICTVSYAGGYSWYFKPKDDGSRPELCPEADFVDNYDTVTIGNAQAMKTETLRKLLTFSKQMK